MVKRLIIHIGDSKTGSTALQLSLRRHAASPDWIYPGASLNHNALALALSRPKFASLAEPRFRAIWQSVEDSSASTAILSAELFQAVDAKTLFEALTAFGPNPVPEISIIAFARPHLPKLIGMYSERVKSGQPVGSIKTYAERLGHGRRLDFAPRFMAWRQQFGSGFVLKPYMPHCDTVAEFFAQTLPNVTPPAQHVRPNASLTEVQVRLLKRVPALALRQKASSPIPAEVHRLICLNLRESNIGRGAPLPNLTGPARAKFQARYHGDAAEMDRSFFQHDPCFLDALFDPLPVEPSLGLDQPSPSQIAWFDHMALGVLHAWQRDPLGQCQKARKALRASVA